MRLSQGQLNLLETCPRKFQNTYLEQLSSPASPEQQDRQDWGSRFHLLMQQRELGLPIASLIEEDPQLERCLTAFINAAPEILTPDPAKNSGVFRQAEHCRTLNFQGYLLTVIYDLLVAEAKSAQILDWKTYPSPQNRSRLEKNWQTRLYLYVLAETSDYLPEQISMTYWFVQSPVETSDLLSLQSLQFSYNDSLHKQAKADLTQLLSNLDIWLQQYQEIGEAFPQVPVANGHCTACNFGTRCERSRETAEAAVTLSNLPNLANIQEISL
ncbi:PD-(D/E)XK nuclease family protein [Microcoleus sp. FACHB-672]|uniref:PD-(D/E)XK nuclease family protein n=1 Tax=Microcoleus sp. FACHB-672 TaxID=2692825 RepID=UPI00168481A3|nr:PD-(D/E)XK nuclease family protein [Microcoleus sp. FACHB-672]MBD2043779.1 PD-(D/E)XK nuclease family protein [Microcoleus sp. FACHB-672]